MTDPSEAASETAKAVQEVAKTTGTALELLGHAGGWFHGRLGEALDQTIGWAITDNVIYHRQVGRLRKVERLSLLAARTQARLNALGVESLTAVDDKSLTAIIEGAALEDDPQIQEMWANLLASALSSEEADQHRFANILRELRPIDAKALEAYASRRTDAICRPNKLDGFQMGRSLSGELYGLDTARNLQRLGLIEPVSLKMSIVTEIISHGYGRGDEAVTATVDVPGSLYNIELTETGEEFCKRIGLEVKPYP